MRSKKYRMICVVDSVPNGDNTISTIDASPDYLHIHILESNQLESIEEFASKISAQEKDATLFQWGIPLQKDAKTRSEVVSAKTVTDFGNVGLGSAAKGMGEQFGDYVGGGEGFLFGDQNFRITKGNAAFKAEEDQKYWIFQTADFNGAKQFSNLKGSTIVGRDNLMDILKECSSGKPFVATFDVGFEGGFFARSNGIFPEDKSLVLNPNQTLFEQEIIGGHLVGGSANSGDLESLRQKFPEELATNIDFTVRIESDVILKPINKLEIARSDGSFREPRTELKVKEATKVIQNFLRQQNNQRK